MCAKWRSDREITECYQRHSKTVIRVCMLYFRGSVQDAEDAVQTTFLKFMKDGTRFRSVDHEKAWLIVTAGNTCKDMLSTGWKRRVDMNETALINLASDAKEDETLPCILALPDSCKTAVYMYYYEGYSVKEIAAYMGKTVSSIEKYLHNGRTLLKSMLKEDR